MEVVSLKNNKRQVNIELLRIISMILVLLVHYNFPLNGKLSLEMYENSIMHYIGVASLCSLDFVCVNCFIIISGYFGIRWKLGGVLSYLFQISFWGGMIYLICWLLGLHNFNPMAMVKQMTLFLFGVNWFFVAYLGLYMIAPVLNAYIEKVSEKELGIFVAVFYIFQTFFGWITPECREFVSGMSFVSFAGLYLLGAYLRKSSWVIFQWEAWTNLGVYLGVGVICVIISIGSRCVGATQSIYSYISPLQIIQTIYLFLFCKALKIAKGEKIVLFFSSSAFAALLMHSWDGGDLYYKGLYWIDSNIQYPFFASILYILLFFSVACVLDKVRIWFWQHVIEDSLIRRNHV